MDNILQIIWAGFLTSVIWFVLGGILYMNPFTAKIYKSHEGHPGLKKWASTQKYMIIMYLLGALLPALIVAFVWNFLNPVFAGGLALKTFYFGLILVGIRIIPRLIDMWIQSTYPNKLLVIELINGTIWGFVAALVLAWLI